MVQFCLLSLLVFFLPQILAFGGYSPEQLDIYDLYDELKQAHPKLNFYTYLKPDLNPSTATKKDIKSAYKKKAVLLHPDKVEILDNGLSEDGLNKDQIENRFRQLSQIKEILTTPELKETYDDVLKNGLPPGMSFRYYRYIMKMSLKQVFIFLFVIVWIVHYLVLWGMYYEKTLIIADHSKRSKRKAKEMASIVIDKPGFFDTLPFVIFGFLKYLVLVLPGELNQKRIDAASAKLLEIERIKQEKRDQEEAEKLKIQREKQREINKQKHKEYILEQQKLAAERYEAALAKAEALQNEEDDEYGELEDEWGSDNEDNSRKKKKKGGKKGGKRGGNSRHGEDEKNYVTGDWSDEENTKMIELMNKWPGGTPDRWERIAEELNRRTTDVMKQLKVIKSKPVNSLKTITIDKGGFNENLGYFCNYKSTYKICR